MNSDILEGKWKQAKGEIKAKWGKLTDDDIDIAQGNTEKFLGIVQEKYGLERDEAQKELDKLTQ
jgi:uncharacterized protein YjbJ (UPF0337 family)